MNDAEGARAALTALGLCLLPIVVIYGGAWVYSRLWDLFHRRPGK